jgi:hypothetical protein
VTQGHGLERLLHARAHPHPLMPVQQQRAKIPLLRRGHPDRGKSILDEQLQKQVRIATIVFLPPRLRLPDGGRMSHAARDRQLLQQPENHPIDPVASRPTTTGPGIDA